MSIPQDDSNDPIATNPNRRGIFLFRHDLKDEENGRPEMLSPRGIEIARVTGGEYLLGQPITRCYASALMRTHQMIAALIAGGHLNVAEATRTVDLMGATMEEWIAHCDKGSTLERIEAAYPSFIESVGDRILHTFREIINNLPMGEMALVASHSPCAEVAIKMLTGVSIPALKPGEGVTLAIDEDGNATLEREMRLSS
jgi:broad specificity phosphatase PhoE